MPNVEIVLNLSGLENLYRAAQDAALETMGALRGEIITARVIPKAYGTLEGSIGAIDQFSAGEELHTTLCIGDTPYARRLYFHPEYNFQKNGEGRNHNAQGEWAQPWLPEGDLEGFVPYTFEERLEERLR